MGWKLVSILEVVSCTLRGNKQTGLSGADDCMWGLRVKRALDSARGERSWLQAMVGAARQAYTW